MRTLSITEDDLVVKNGDFVFVDGIEEIETSLERRLTTLLSEFFLEPSLGLRYEPITRKNPDLDAIREAIGECITQDPRVISLDSIEIDLDKERNVLIKFSATTTLGNIELEVS